MTVKELIDILSTADPNAVIVVSSDEEGNSYRYAHNIDATDLNCEGSWEVEIGLRKLTQEYIDRGYTDEDVLEDGTPCVVIW